MRYFIFTILLVVPLLLTAQSKKEQIATLNLRVDSLFEVLVNNAQTLSNKSDKIFQLSQEKVGLEKDIAVCVDSKNNTLNALVESNSSLEGLKGELQLAQDENSEMRSNLQDVNNGEPLFKDYTGEAQLYDENGERQYLIRFKDGKADGVSIKHPDCDWGCLSRNVPYKDGKVEGLCITTWEEWGEAFDTSYRIETLVKDGKRVSQISYFYNGESEDVVSKIVYKIGTREEGIMRSYLDNEHESYQITRYHYGEIVSKKCMYGGDDNDEPYEISCD